MPAYNAAKTLERTVRDIPSGCVDDIIVVDDASTDETVKVAERLGLQVIVHSENRGYGANQKTCYDEALRREANIDSLIYGVQTLWTLVKYLAHTFGIKNSPLFQARSSKVGSSLLTKFPET